MSFTATPTDGSSTPIPMSSAVPDGTNTPLAVEGGPSKTTGGNNLAPVAVYLYDGYNVTQGTQGDANTANTVMGRLTKLRDLLNSVVAADGAAMAGFGVAIGASDGTNLQTLLVEAAAHPNLRMSLYNAGNEAAVDASGRLLVNIGQYGGSAVVTGTGASGAGIPRMTVANDSNILATQSGTWTVQPGNTANTTPWLVSEQAATSGGSTPSHTMSAAATNATSLKASAGQVYGLSISNAASSARYFKLYNKASAPTVGTDTPVLTVQVPALSTVIRAYPQGLALGTGIAWACTGGIADADTTTIGANDCSIDIDYK